MTPGTNVPSGTGNRDLHRVMLVLVAVAVFGFALFNLSGATDIREMPLISHVHAVVMSAWLGLIAVQSDLGSRGRISLHRRLGRLGVGLAAIAVVTGLLTVIHTISAGRLPPFFTPGYFLTLGIMNLGLFAGFVTAAVVMRKNTGWHRRWMLGALIVIFEPVLGRLLPLFVIPLFGGPENALPVLIENRGAFELLRLFAHVVIVVIVMLVDRAATGRFHRVYGFILAAVLMLYAVVNGVGNLAPVADFAARLASVET